FSYVASNTHCVKELVGYQCAGSNTNPIIKEDARFNLKQMGMSERIVDFDVELGEVVKIIDGQFNNQIGSIDQIDEEHLKLTVLVELFGRETPVEVEYDQIEKID